MLFAQRSDAFRPYHDTVFERFWCRELDIEDIDAIQAVLTACGVDTSGFADYVSSEGAEMLARVQREAEAQGVFGVPSFLLDDGDLYWGREHLAAVRERLVSQ
jgi:2-hydroxychromene-2-carboxylate isomerase